MTVRIDVSRLDDEVREMLERGESVEIERDGKVVGRMEPCDSTEKRGLRGFLELRLQHEPVDEDFERDLQIAREMLNRPVVTEPWDR